MQNSGWLRGWGLGAWGLVSLGVGTQPSVRRQGLGMTLLVSECLCHWLYDHRHDL